MPRHRDMYPVSPPNVFERARGTNPDLRDPMADAYYSNDPDLVNIAVRQGYARGGNVWDPMDYIPDQLPERREQRNTYDPYNTIGREEPQVSPYMAYAPETGYANGGSVGSEFYDPDPREEEDLKRRTYGLRRDEIGAQQQAIALKRAEMERQDEDARRAYLLKGGGQSLADATATRIRTEQGAGARTGYSEPAPTQSGPALGNVMDYIHGMFNIGGAQAAENPHLPQRAAPAEPDPNLPRRPATGYDAGGYGGELTSPRPEAQGGSTYDVTDKPMPAPLSLQAPSPPSISGQDTPRVAAVPGDSYLGQTLAAQEARRKAEGPVSERGILDLVTSLPRAGIEHLQRRIGERELYGGTSFGATDTWNPVGNTPAWTGIRNTLEGLIGGDHPKTPDEVVKVLGTISQNPQAQHSPMVQKTFDELGRTGGVDAQANFLQAIRPGYDKLGGIKLAAMSQGRLDLALKFFERQQDLLPNNINTTAMVDPKGGGIVINMRPEDGSSGGTSYRLTAAQFYDLNTGPATQFDHVGKQGLEAALKKIVASGGVQAPPPLDPGQIRPSGPGGTILSGPGGVPRPGSSDYMGGAGAPGMTRADTVGGQFTRYDPSTETKSTRPRYDVERNIGESERPSMTDRAVGEGVQRIIAGTRGAAEAAMQNRTPEGGVLDPTAPARSLTAQDPRSIANREDFVRRVTAPRPAGPRPPIQGEAPRPAPAPVAPAAQAAAPAVASQPAAPAAQPARAQSQEDINAEAEAFTAPPVRITSPEQLAKLPRGARYFAPDGTLRIKQT